MLIVMFSVEKTHLFATPTLPKTECQAQNTPKWTFVRHNVVTSLRHDIFSPHANGHLNHVHVSTKIEANQSVRPQWQKTA